MKKIFTLSIMFYGLLISTHSFAYSECIFTYKSHITWSWTCDNRGDTSNWVLQLPNGGNEKPALALAKFTEAIVSNGYRLDVERSDNGIFGNLVFVKP